MLIDAYMPVHDYASAHEVAVHAGTSSVVAAVLDQDLSASTLVRTLFALRGMPRRAVTLRGIEQVGFRRLGHEPGEELLLGLIGRFWTLRGGLVAFEPAQFVDFDRPGYAKATWNFSMRPGADGTTLLSTETRIHCTDPLSRRRFGRYWAVIRPFSGVVRREALRVIRQRAEASSHSGR